MKSSTLKFAGMFSGLALALGALALTGASATAGPEHDHGKASRTAQVGEKAPNFTLTDLNGAEHTLKDYLKDGKTVVLEWYNPDCPFVVRHHKTWTTMRDLHNDFKDRGVVLLAINSGAPGKQGAGLERNLRSVEEYGIAYPVLLDESGKVGKMYDAKTTPHMYIITPDGVLRYDGAIDDSRRGNPTVNYVRQALEQILAGETLTNAKTTPYGCSVKYAD